MAHTRCLLHSGNRTQNTPRQKRKRRREQWIPLKMNDNKSNAFFYVFYLPSFPIQSPYTMCLVWFPSYSVAANKRAINVHGKQHAWPTTKTKQNTKMFIEARERERKKKRRKNSIEIVHIIRFQSIDVPEIEQCHYHASHPDCSVDVVWLVVLLLFARNMYVNYGVLYPIVSSSYWCYAMIC